MKRSIILVVIITASLISKAQVNLIYASLSASTSITDIENGKFHRSLFYNNGVPSVQFNELENHKLAAMGAGMTVERISKKWRLGVDLQWPFASNAHYLYAGLSKAWWIKDKLGFGLGLSIMAKPSGKKKMNDKDSREINGHEYQNARANLMYKDTGYYYLDRYDNGGWGLDMSLMYAFNENFVFRTTASPMLMGFLAPESVGDTRWDNDAKGFRWENAIAWSNGSFGFFFRHSITKITRNYYVNDLMPTVGGSATTEMELFPQSKAKAHVFTVGIMLPPEWLGNSRIVRGTITSD